MERMERMELGREIQWLVREKYEGKRTKETERDIARLERGEHIDYVIGWVDFLGCRIGLEQKPLIPRAETVYWTERAIQNIKKYKIQNTKYKILDLFSGSGCVGIAVLKHVPQACVDFADIDSSCLVQIEMNAQRNGIEKHRYGIVRSNVCSGITGTYDYILANPPYVAQTRRQHVQESVVEQEPYHAVFGGGDGLVHIRCFIEEVRQCLAPDGRVYMEFDPFQKEAIGTLLTQHGFSLQEFFRDQYGKWRFVVFS